MRNIRFFIFLIFVFSSLASGCSTPCFSTFVTFTPDTARTVPPETLLQARKVLQKRLDASLAGKSVVQVENNTLRVGLSNENDLPAAIALGIEPGMLAFFHSDSFIATGEPMPANATVIMTGADIAHAKVSLDSTMNLGIEITLNPAGKTKLAEYTRTHVGAYLVIAQDNLVISAPKINAAITGGSAVIQGNFNRATAELLATVLNSGALPVPLKVEK